MEDESEATTTEIHNASVRFGRHHDAGCLQKESGASAATSSTATDRTYGFADGQSEHRRKRSVHDSDGIGAVQPNGSQSVTPADSTTYTLTAKGAGGTQTATARVTVTSPPPPPQASATEEELFSQTVKDIYFDYDKSDVNADQQSSLQEDIAFLKQHPNISFTIEGHCDERGSTEYNLALGDSRASSVRNALVQGGVTADHVKTISYGKEKPFCTESNEQCWQQNRRGHFVYLK
jgi:peptidoglycan-associated lipoprotein